MVLISLIYFNFLRYLYQEMRDTMRRKLIFVNPVIVSKAGTTKPKLENRARYIAERLLNSRKAEYFCPIQPRVIVLDNDIRFSLFMFYYHITCHDLLICVCYPLVFIGCWGL